jgi:endonuclease/exonuclease/phosphatase family metal-dependent hydrolase
MHVSPHLAGLFLPPTRYFFFPERAACGRTEAESGGWRERARAIVGLVVAARPDVVCLQEFWFNGDDAQQLQQHHQARQDEADQESMLALFRRRLGDMYTHPIFASSTRA